MKIGLIFGSSRPSDRGQKLAEWWAKENAADDVEFELIDLAEVNLPFFDEEKPPIAGDYHNDHTKKWAAMIDPLDGFVMFTAEYNHGPTPILKNAIDYLFKEWKDKPVALVGYGAAPKSHSVEMLDHILNHMGMKVVSSDMHITPINEAITDDGVDDSKIAGSSADEIMQKLLSA